MQELESGFSDGIWGEVCGVYIEPGIVCDWLVLGSIGLPAWRWVLEFRKRAGICGPGLFSFRNFSHVSP